MDQEPRSEKLNLLRRIDELQTMFPLQSSERTLGHAAVAYANHHAAIILEMGQYEIETDGYQRYGVLEKSFRSSVSGELGDVRQTIAALTYGNEQYLDLYLNMQTPFTHMARMIAGAEKKVEAPLTWKQWLTEYATNDELLNFLQFHNNIIEHQQTDVAIEEAINDQKQKFTYATKNLRDEGILVGSLDGIDKIDLEVGDIFDMVMKERIGFYQIGIDKIHIQQGYFRGPHKLTEEFLDTMPHVAVHELVHAVFGESYKQFDGPLAARWINEAITEVLTRSINHKLGALDEKDATYLNERMLLHCLLSHAPLANEDLAYKFAIRAFSGSKDDRVEFESYLDIIWRTKDVLGKINHAIECEEVKYSQSDPKSQRDAQAKALGTVYLQLRNTPDNIFVQYDEVIEALPKIAAQE